MILPEFYNIKGLSAGTACRHCKLEPEDSGQFWQNPQSGAYFGAFRQKSKPKGNNPMILIFNENLSKSTPVKRHQNFRLGSYP
ncbi:MAG: hypothetical protein ACR2OR_07190 [Hyphomicrobiales bacterium]